MVLGQALKEDIIGLTQLWIILCAEQKKAHGNNNGSTKSNFLKRNKREGLHWFSEMEALPSKATDTMYRTSAQSVFPPL